MTKAANEFRERQSAVFMAMAASEPVPQAEQDRQARARQKAIDRAEVGHPAGNTVGPAVLAPATSVMLKGIGIAQGDIA